MASIGAKIDALHGLRERKRKLEESVKKVELEIGDAQAELIHLLGEAGLTASKGKKASVSISELIVPAVEDWDEFWRFIRRKNYFHLLHKRPSVSGCRELFDANKRIPGVVPHVQRTLNLRTAS